MVDYYEELQISPNADQETVRRVYRILARRYHPDNSETGNENRFRQLNEAYEVLNDPARRAQYDVGYQSLKAERWHVVPEGDETENDFVLEQRLRLTLLEILYTRRRLESSSPGLYITALEKIIGKPREHLEFAVWYLIQKKYVQRGDNSVLTITAEGVEHVEQQSDGQRRLRSKKE